MTTTDLIARLRAGTVTPEICEQAALALEQGMDCYNQAFDEGLELAAIHMENAPLKEYTIYPDEWKSPSEAAEYIRSLKGTTK